MADWIEPQSSNDTNFFKRWTKRLWKWFKNFFALIGFVYTVVPIVLVWFIMHNMNPPAKTADDTKKSGKPVSLWLELDRHILAVEPRMSQKILQGLFGGDDGLYLPTLRATLRKASEDASISDLQIVIDGLSGSMADMEELRQVITDFQAKKPVTSWLRHLDNSALLISSATDRVILSPVAEVMIPGPAFPQIYFGDALKKLGVEMQVVRAGKYKSAFEAFIANEPSPESKEMMSSLEASLRNHMIKLLAKGRKKQESETNLWLRESVFTAAKAKELGIVDELGYVAVLEKMPGDAISFDDYQAENSSSKPSIGYSLTPEKGIALIEAAGEIVGTASGEGQITPSALQEELEWARTNEHVNAVVLRIDSPGGSASASDEIWEFVRRLSAEKPVIASFGSVAASGGYYIAAAAKKIIADPTTITGSIGVIGMIPNLEGFKDKYGVTFPITTQSNRQAMLSGGKKMTPEDHKYIGASIDETYHTFKSRVSDGRKLTMEQVEALAQGRVYSGLQAKELGLVDELGTLKDAFQVAKKEAGLDENKLYPILRYEPNELSLSECLSSGAKMRKCLRRHGASIKTSLKNEIVGASEAKEITALLQAKNRFKQEKIFALYFGDVSNF